MSKAKKYAEEGLVKPKILVKPKPFKNRFHDDGTLYKEKPKPLRGKNGRFIKKATIADAINNPEIAKQYGFTVIKEEKPPKFKVVDDGFMAELNNRIERQKEWEENEARLLSEEIVRQVELRIHEKRLKTKFKNFVLSSWYELKYTSLLAKIWLVESLWVKPVKSIRLMGTRTKSYFKKSNNSKIR